MPLLSLAPRAAVAWISIPETSLPDRPSLSFSDCRPALGPCHYERGGRYRRGQLSLAGARLFGFVFTAGLGVMPHTGRAEIPHDDETIHAPSIYRCGQ